MNIWFTILLVWFIIDMIRYVMYVLTYRKLDSPELHRDTNHKNIIKMLNDLKQNPSLLHDLLIDMFYSRIKLEDMNFDDVYDVLFELIGEYSQYRDDVRKLIKDFQLREKKTNNR